MAKLLTRTLSGLVLVAIIIMFTLLGNEFLLFTILTLSIIASYEFYQAMKIIGYNYPLPLQIIFAIALTYAMYISHEFMAVAILAVMFIILMALACLGNKYRLKDIMAMLFSIIYINFIFSIFLLFEDKRYIILIFTCAWGTDTFAYIFGMLFGRHKLIERLSPGKSIEGAIGGVFGSVLATLIILYLIGTKELLDLFVLAVITSIASQVGDLCASYIKRRAKLKDYGYIILGHGGVLDRFDSVLFVVPIVYLVSVIVFI